MTIIAPRLFDHKTMETCTPVVHGSTRQIGGPTYWWANEAHLYYAES